MNQSCAFSSHGCPWAQTHKHFTWLNEALPVCRSDWSIADVKKHLIPPPSQCAATQGLALAQGKVAGHLLWQQHMFGSAWAHWRHHTFVSLASATGNAAVLELWSGRRSQPWVVLSGKRKGCGPSKMDATWEAEPGHTPFYFHVRQIRDFTASPAI